EGRYPRILTRSQLQRLQLSWPQQQVHAMRNKTHVESALATTQ
ncbi:hypothetical protein O5254_26955, partial [Escherichia coli]|nr:hypothetical protein [Escherichia coli]